MGDLNLCRHYIKPYRTNISIKLLHSKECNTIKLYLVGKGVNDISC